MLRLSIALALLLQLCSAQILPVVFDCNSIPETCNNMCYADSRNVYNNPFFYNSNRANRRGRRTAAGCAPANRNWCRGVPVTNTCDEYPFASTYGIGALGWYAGTGATTRCVSLAECRSQGGSLSSFYRTFNYADGQPFEAAYINIGASPYCTPGAPNPPVGFRTGGAPPNFQGDATVDPPIEGGNTTISSDQVPLGADLARRRMHKYLTKNRRQVYSYAILKKGDKIFIPKPNWFEKHLESSGETFDDQDEDCEGSAAQDNAARRLPVSALGTYDYIDATS